MGICCVYGCSNRTDRKRRIGVSFHRFPKDELLKKQWIMAVQRLNWIPGPNTFVCSEHFEDNFLNRTFASGVTELRENAVPTIFPSYPSHLHPRNRKICKPPPTCETIVPVFDPIECGREEPMEMSVPSNKEIGVQSSAKREQWMECLSQDLDSTHSVCELHFSETAIRKENTFLIHGNVTSLANDRRTLTDDALPIHQQPRQMMDLDQDESQQEYRVDLEEEEGLDQQEEFERQLEQDQSKPSPQLVKLDQQQLNIKKQQQSKLSKQLQQQSKVERKQLNAEEIQQLPKLIKMPQQQPKIIQLQSKLKQQQSNSTQQIQLSESHELQNLSKLPKQIPKIIKIKSNSKQKLKQQPKPNPQSEPKQQQLNLEQQPLEQQLSKLKQTQPKLEQLQLMLKSRQLKINSKQLTINPEQLIDLKERQENGQQSKLYVELQQPSQQPVDGSVDLETLSLLDVKHHFHLLPESWCYILRPAEILFVYMSRYNMQEKLRLRLDSNLSVSVTFTGRKELPLNECITSLKELRTCFAAAEKWTMCTGTGFEDNRYDPRCLGFLDDGEYERQQYYPRCKACRAFRRLLQKSKNSKPISSTRISLSRRKLKRFKKKCNRLVTSMRRLKQKLFKDEMKSRGILKS